MANGKSFLDFPPRQPEGALSQEYMNLAYAIQSVTEEILLQLVTTAKQLTCCSNLVLAGGVALNCVANGKIESSKLFDQYGFNRQQETPEEHWAPLMRHGISF